ncbi:MAG: 1-deoxy-D-xylulose-5-phosphate synthase [Anaerostipes sp.]|nr:1-deoxy-D-xylulose-5-phosphate synthase [Anaerostipes sp.]
MLDKIKTANDIKKIDPSRYNQLAKEIRRFLLKHISVTGGHLASNLGIVELTMALHLVLDFPKDKLIFDVGHQSYVHKILTGRQEEFSTLRQYKGMSGFPNRQESDCDAFHSGHSSTSIATAMGMATARDLKGTKETIVALLGDGAFTGGMAYEALNNLVRFRDEKKNLIVVLNDNNMSISKNVGGMSSYFNRLRTKKEYLDLKGNVEKSLKRIPVVGETLTNGIRKSKNSMKQLFVPGMVFEDMGVTYIGPIDGHNVPLMVDTFRRVKKLDEPIIVHVITKKGKGYSFAEKNPSKFHGIGPFSVKTGEVLGGSVGKTYTKVFSDTLMKLSRKDETICAISAAMPAGTGLEPFQKEFPERFFDVGIAEEHAVTFSAGLAVNGMKPVVALYSTFLQRAYDQMIHDVALENLDVVIGVDRSGLVGADGETHQGIFDIPYLSSIPNMTIMAPSTGAQLEEMLTYSLTHSIGPAAIKYARGEAFETDEFEFEPFVYGKGQILKRGSKVAIIAVGNILEEVVKACSILKENHIHPTVVDPRFIKPIDKDLIQELMKSHDYIVTVEEGVLQGGFGSQVACVCVEHGYKGTLKMIGIQDQFVPHGSVAQLRKMLKIDAESIANQVMEL